MNCFARYYIYKWLREGDRIAERRRAERSRKKSRKKYLISTYGYEYYLRDKTWEKIKNQKKKEGYEAWKRRLAIYGFTVHGLDVKRNEQHFGKPLVHEYVFGDETEMVEISKKGVETMKKLTLEEILKSFNERPRDVITRNGGVWFYAYADDKNVYIEAGRNHTKCSRITVRRRLDIENFETVYEMYLNSTPRNEICDVTLNSSYWYGILSELSDRD